MKHCMKLITSLALLIVCFTLAFGATASAHTSTQARASNPPPVVIGNTICCGESSVILESLQLYPQTSGNITNSFTVSNQFSASIGVDVKVVTTSLGFDVTQSYTLSANCSANNTTNQVQILDYVAVYTTYDYEIMQSGQKIGVGSAGQYNHDQCFYAAALPPV